MTSARPSKASARPSVRLKGFQRDSIDGRRQRLVEAGWLTVNDAEALGQPGLDEAAAGAMIENVIGLHTLPLAVGLNFVVNGEERLIPMAVEEPSIVAASSYAARLASAGGGFRVEADPPLLAAQIQLCEVKDLVAATQALTEATPRILEEADRLMPQMKLRGGGARDVELRPLSEDMLCVHIVADTRDAMGANLVNTVAEGLGGLLAEVAGARVGLRILSNLSDRRKVYVRCRVPLEALASEQFPDGGQVREAIIAAQRFAELDPYRAATHNKGVMNGVDAVLLACGNDWRAVEAGAHAFAAQTGKYLPLTSWAKGGDGALEGTLTMPLATSTVGGAARNHPGVRRAIRLAQIRGALDLAMLAGAAGLACNLSALKALSTEGIQRGHMALHARRVAAEVGCSGELLERVADQLAAERVYRPERAQEIRRELEQTAFLPRR